MLGTNTLSKVSKSSYWNGRPRIGARWDGNVQTSNFLEAKAQGLLDYIELNFPLADGEDPWSIGLPVLSHTANNPLASAFGICLEHATLVRDQLAKTDSPWTGEHLAVLGETTGGALGYVINPPLTKEFFQTSCRNIDILKKFYCHPIALELGPFYSVLTDGTFRNEFHFLNEVARMTDCLIILDLTHALITSRNLCRASNECLEEIDRERVVELHVAGMRSSGIGNRQYWFDAHQIPPSEPIFDLIEQALRVLPNVKAITLEYSMEGKSDGFFLSLIRLAKILGRH